MYCYRCRDEKEPEEMVANPKASERGWKSGECKNCHRTRSRAWAAANPDKKRSCVLRRRYGITLEERDAIFSAQDGLCAICNKPMRRNGKGGAYVDHDHTTGEIRGLLCPSCNTSLEWMLTYGREAQLYVKDLLS